MLSTRMAAIAPLGHGPLFEGPVRRVLESYVDLNMECLGDDPQQAAVKQMVQVRPQQESVRQFIQAGLGMGEYMHRFQDLLGTVS